MEQITIRLRANTIESLEAEAEERGVSRSEYIRNVLDRRDELEELEAEVKRLRDELRAANARTEEHTELVRYVEEEVEYRAAPVWTRARWWLMGKA